MTEEQAIRRGFVFNQLAGGDLEIVDYVGKSRRKDLVIPDTIGGRKVTRIASRAFPAIQVYCLVLPRYLEYIGDHAFIESQIKRLSAQDSIRLKRIGHHAFYNCGIKEPMTIPASVEFIGQDAFADNPLTTVELMPRRITIQSNAFGWFNEDLTIYCVNDPAVHKELCGYKFVNTTMEQRYIRHRKAYSLLDVTV